ncbi:hypothetical protein Pst134EA_011303 [Puccinia striiformis f. sp. tritici]|uniref:hypothetical protein n=1 Tax=Puccinia striiformis f. sp. tritici TaxID=168172 RepID=UPI0020073512|nr:hypothetical protein Pst134EA_011303 [Puccinia striiformis f. sp. tritici]KAH9467667.1 hypothetical protein Pst134EA_011303 [Puccinia striiformis f. sp. tritici]
MESSQALKLYEATNKATSAKTKNRSFGHLRCWHILAPSAKFKAYCADLEDKALALDGANPSEIPTSDATDGSNRTERPGGIKSAHWDPEGEGRESRGGQRVEMEGREGEGAPRPCRPIASTEQDPGGTKRGGDRDGRRINHED